MLSKIKQSSKGAADLSSIMVGVTIVGVLGGVIAATVFVAIPWAQDNATKQQLESVATAQAAYAGTTAPITGFSLTSLKPTVIDNAARYGSLQELNDKKLFKITMLEGSSTVQADGKLCVVADDVKGYEAAAISDTGKVFSITSADTTPVQINSGVTCLGTVVGGKVDPSTKPVIKPTMTSVWDTRLYHEDWSEECDTVNGPCLITCETIMLPLQGAVNVDVDWGDGKISKNVSDNPTHTYTGAKGIKNVKVSGRFTGWGIRTDYHVFQPCITEVTSWGETGTSNMFGAFYRAEHLVKVKEIPSGVTDMRFMFSEAVIFNDPSVATWDTSSVTTMAGMFSGARLFNQNIGNWNTSNVNNMVGMFQGVINIDRGDDTVFSDRFINFNQDISNWDVSKVTTMESMFENAVEFNQPIGKWNTASLTNLSMTFQSASKFNQPLSNWKTAKLTNLYATFNYASAFNQNINNWDTSKVTNMSGTFGGTVFNQPLNNWKTDNVTDMSGMFDGALAFNQPIATWNTIKVTNMSRMFAGSGVFNQPIGSWNTGNVVNMVRAFENAKAFNQNISTWNVINVNQYSGSPAWLNFRNGSPLTTANTPLKFR